MKRTHRRVFVLRAKPKRPSEGFLLAGVEGQDRAAAGNLDVSRAIRAAANAAIRAGPAGPAARAAEHADAILAWVLLGRRAMIAACRSRRHRRECRCHSAQWPPLDPKPSADAHLASLSDRAKPKQAGPCRVKLLLRTGWISTTGLGGTDA